MPCGSYCVIPGMKRSCSGFGLLCTHVLLLHIESQECNHPVRTKSCRSGFNPFVLPFLYTWQLVSTCLKPMNLIQQRRQLEFWKNEPNDISFCILKNARRMSVLGHYTRQKKKKLLAYINISLLIKMQLQRLNVFMTR